MTELEFGILNQIQQWLQCDFLDFFMPRISALGNGGFIWIAAGLLLLISKRYRKDGVCVLLALLLSFLICNLTLKPLAARMRPCWETVQHVLLIPVPRDFSFPSGHTASSFAAATAIFHANRRLGWCAFALAAVIAFSRLYLYVHFPTDVLAGALLGAFCAWVVMRVLFRAAKPRRAKERK